MENNFSVKTMTVNIEEKNYEKSTENNLKDFLNQFNEIEYKEITLDGNNSTSLMIEMNKNKSLCIFWEDIKKDITYHSLNKNGQKELYEEFVIPNGQRDLYEDIYLINNNKIYEVIEYYYNYGKRSENIIWEQD